MNSFLLWLYRVKLLVVYLESRWKKVKSDVLAATFVSGWRHWSDNVLISRPLPSRNHSQEQEVRSVGDSHCLRAVMGQMSPGRQLTHLWAVTIFVTSYLKDREKKWTAGVWGFFFCFLINMVGQSKRETSAVRAETVLEDGIFFTHIESLWILHASFFSLHLSYMEHTMRSKSNRKSHHHIWCFNFEYR